MNLVFDSRWIGDHGIGRFAREVRARLPGAVDFQGGVRPSSAFDAAHLSLRLACASRSSFFFSPGYSAPLRTRVPYIFTIHDLNHIHFDQNKSVLKAQYYEHVMKPACFRARAVLTVSEYSRDRICDWSGIDQTRVINVGNGLDAVFGSHGPKYAHPKPYVICMGNRKPHKNERRTVSAFASLASRIPHDLLFSGKPSGGLTEHVRDSGLADRISFLGELTDDQLASVYRGAAALLFVSLYEGFGLPVIEAMACGTPVITSNVCSLPEVAGGAALCVDPLSVNEIAAALEKVLSCKSTADGMIQRGLVNARRYSWERTGAAVRLAIESSS
jgi:glycosyltransferase involved in cell wall biosynthesis